MKKLFCLNLLFLWLRIPLNAQVIITAEADSLIQLGIQNSINQFHVGAIEIFSRIEKEMPKSPVGYFFHAAALQSKMMDYEIYEEEQEFIDLVKKTIHLSQLILKKHPRDAWAYYFLGGGLGYLAFHQAKQNQLVKAFKNGMKSYNTLKLALKSDSTLYDLYFGIGTYMYYRSKFSRFFTWIPFVSDDRSRGIKFIKIAIEKGKYSRYAAINGLCWISLEEGNLEEGWQYVTRALEEFPSSRVFLWCAAELAAKLNLWEEALNYYDKILISFKNENVPSPYNEILCHQQMAQIHFRLENFKNAKKECEIINNIKINEETKKQLGSKLKKLKKIQKSCDLLLKNSLIPQSSH
ncbi:MAG: tetratricopeptide repeat protein [bacterium]